MSFVPNTFGVAASGGFLGADLKIKFVFNDDKVIYLLRKQTWKMGAVACIAVPRILRLSPQLNGCWAVPSHKSSFLGSVNRGTLQRKSPGVGTRPKPGGLAALGPLASWRV